MKNSSTLTAALPLCVDLDGTLVTADTLVELLLVLIKKKPIIALTAVGWLLKGKGYFKEQVTTHSHISTTYLPYHQGVLKYLQAEHARGRKIFLVTASARQFAQQVADHIGLFEGVLGSDRQHNYAGTKKAEVLTERFGLHGFVYIGNARVDLTVWESAAAGSVVTNRSGLVAQARQRTTIEHIFPAPYRATAWLKAIRVKQWIKNLLVFVPLIAAHKVADPKLLLNAIIAFGAFAAASSSVYLLNDLLDLEADRRHPTKKNRPFAAGHIASLWGIAASATLLISSFLIALQLPLHFMGLLALYLTLTLLYSFRLKRVVLLDVFLLATLYTIRIFAGAAAIAVPVSSWLTAFALFFFLSLAMVKRFTELRRLKQSDQASAHGRGYTVHDSELIAHIGITSGCISAVILALYISSPEIYSLYITPWLLWALIPLLLFWISRVWLLAHRGELDEDPTTFAVKDGPSYMVVIALLIIVFIASRITV